MALDDRARDDLLPFARWLSDHLKRRRLTKNDLARALGVGQSAVSEYTRAIRRPRLEALRRISDYFETPLEDLEAMLPPEASRIERDEEEVVERVAERLAELVVERVGAWPAVEDPQLASLIEATRRLGVPTAALEGVKRAWWEVIAQRAQGSGDASSTRNGSAPSPAPEM